MARDGLLPPSFFKVHPRYKTPHVTTIWIGVVVGVLAAFANLDVFVELTNIGTLFAFILVCIGIMVLRKTDPNRRRSFRTPLVPLTPILGILICLYLIVGVPACQQTPTGTVLTRYGGLPWETWVRFGVWLVIGLVIYFAYGFRKSRLANPKT
jgi:basic amino acid/polyamine antiporter, APA family